VLIVLVVRALVAVAVRLRGGRRRPDASYDPPPRVPAEPGARLRVDPFGRGIPATGRAWRILYTTTRLDRTPAVATAIVVVPEPRPAGPLPVIAWAHGTTGVARHCAPSLLDDPWEAGALLVLDEVLARGWAVVATDYIGLGTPGPHRYLVGVEAAHAVLDALRAARGMDRAGELGRAVVWGHSQGGAAALWTGTVAPGYARDVELLGVAALAPASDLTALAGNLAAVPGGSVFAAYTVAGLAATYPEIELDRWVRAGCRRLVRVMAGHGLRGGEVAVGLVAALVVPKPVWSRDPSSGALGARLAENVPPGPIAAPVLIGQGQDDPLIPSAAQAAYADRLAATGTAVELRTYAGFDHMGVVGRDSPLVPELLEWTAARFAEAG
jgi:alpha-beta hydrolase superfamily lysophospholipase